MTKRTRRNTGRLFEAEMVQCLNYYGVAFKVLDPRGPAFMSTARPCDIFASINSIPLLVECKATIQGRILVRERFWSQLERLHEWERVGGAVGMVALNFREDHTGMGAAGTACLIPRAAFVAWLRTKEPPRKSISADQAAGVFAEFALNRDGGAWAVPEDHICAGMFHANMGSLE